MARTSDAPIEDYSCITTFGTRPGPKATTRLSYRIEKQDDQVFHHEILESADGEVIYDLSVPVHYAVGSGSRGRSYLTNRDGILFMSPATWYADADRWDLSPGYEHRNQHFGRRIVDGCLSCHAGHVDDVADLPDQYAQEPFLEMSIGCEKCHGPGKEHVAYYTEPDAGHTDSIVNPAKLSMELQNAVCFQCHLTGEHRLPRYGRTTFDFRPGDRVTDIWTVLVKGTGVDDSLTTAAVSQAEQMLSSACFQRSGGALGCVSCHDPHRLPAEQDRVEFYRTSCLNCHGPNDTQCSVPREQRLETTVEDSCILCHMPRLDANDVPHISQTDHRVLRNPELTTLSATDAPDLQIFRAEEIP
ncbi:MAG: multiheme c-type cytochrome, partial [Maioricimonas sp. JB049]